MISLSPVERPCRAATVLLVALFLLPTVEAELIPSERLVGWTPGVRTGVIGGIPTNRTSMINVTQGPYNADNTGTNDATAAIQAAINAAAPNQVVYMPAGTYRINGSLTIYNKSITLRGAGPNVTILDKHGAINSVITVGTGSGVLPPNGMSHADCVVTDGKTKGSTTVTIGNASQFTVGNVLQFSPENDSSIPVFGVTGYNLSTQQPLQRQLARLVSKTGTTLTFFPPLYRDYTGLNLEVWEISYVTKGVGLEDFTIDGTNGTPSFGIWILQCYGSWVKNVTSRKVNNYPLYLEGSLNCEVRHSYFGPGKDGGSNGAGVLCNTISACLIEDNIINHCFPLLEVNHGSSGNVFAYNFAWDPISGHGFDINHGPHNSFNLYEGNVTPNVLSDGYFGGNSDDTVFRNWLHGRDATNNPSLYAGSLKRFSRRISFVGNVMLGTPDVDGTPNIGNGSWEGTASLINDDPWEDWEATAVLTTRTSDDAGVLTLNSGRVREGDTLTTIRWSPYGVTNYKTFYPSSVAGNVVTIGTVFAGQPLPPDGTMVKVFMQPPGYQEKDLDVAATTIKKGNRYTNTNAFDSLGGDELPSSLFRTSKPSWFKDLVWPPFDPVTPRAPSFEHIPAGYRYVHGVDPPGDIPQAPSNLTSPSPPVPGDRPQGASPAPKAGASAKPQVLTATETETASGAATISPTPTPKAEKPKRKTIRKKSGGS